MATAMDVEVVFSQGQQGYHTFRIPALVYHDGVFLAFCEARKDTYKDWGPMDIVLKRGVQQEGGGLEWSDVQTVCCVPDKRCMNPTPIVDRTNGTIHLLFGTIPPQVTEHDMIRDGVHQIRLCIVKSKDNGVTWTEPEDLTDKVLGKENPQWACFALAPGHGIQLKSGRLVAPGNHMVKKSSTHAEGDFLQGGVARSFVVFSDDHGETWQLGGKVPESPENLHTSECQAVEIVKKDGSSSLCLNIRTLGPHARRQQSFSEDGGLTFSPGQLVDELVEPCKTGPMMPTVKNYGGCQGSVVAATPPSNLRPEGSEFKNWVLFANPNHLSLRENMSLKVSKDGCRTWSPGLVLHKGPSAYSDLATYEEGGAVKVACLFEKGQEHPYETISLQRMSLEDVVKGTSG
ncbi:PREDICTED: sialidase-3-like isoform X3 [Branchiostoma belcheri]|uniref:exo-alpha-sialidase n=1 Tax=Branchiostoma belcheri TaxID=7741 RepID=A0A6P4ZVL7_BRABE|nr:PREDICTED: sialidase-3-like isoform X3 [Branchiostoma belcheri]